MSKGYKKSDLEYMDLELGDHKDLPLSLFEKLHLWFNKNIINGGTGSGKGYNCNNNLNYFKRTYELRSAN